jgi:D-glycero-alpha-D-manno-heptose-7-phosphate kinase
MSRALGLFSEREDSIHDIIMYGASLEAQNLRIPTGYQDYYGACLGGVNGLEFKVDGHNIRTLYSSPDFFRQLTEFMIISFTGQSHFSGTSNWNMLKRYVDNEGDTVKRMEAIEDTAHQMWDALICEDMNRVAAALDREWQNRRGLAEGVTNERIDAMVLAAKNAGALASKICGAGGGGCMLTLCAPDKRAQVLEALRNRGAEILEATIDTEGMKVV